MKKTYEFENLGCAHCAGKMEEKIGKLPDVESVNLSFPMKKCMLKLLVKICFLRFKRFVRILNRMLL